ncbi:hypothetical protein HBI38_001050 [Parastagonospora nodorum]|nr:hypothetical protein HBH74_013280 [Parastagonospora nodorum]KAH4996923.1 hypothetical protein HBH73_000310 [Parastagonospora nodorum]KAH5191554.1 hypothetical protein HBH76_077200 [Parastagonospora nodorum]KAH5673597.1 hypothetical protein HBI21_148810 [Parastagonospora nodorum]KAH6228397.1 hypothetical protein HBI15_082880 [Parastagonospora nodorum]
MLLDRLGYEANTFYYAATACLVLATVVVFVDYGRMLLLRRKLPPGPFPFPIVGNHYQISKDRPWLQWAEWAEYYNNPMTTIWVGREHRIIVQDAWVASDLLEKRADIFSSRPRFVVMGDLVDATTTNQTTLVYGDRWRIHRKLMHGVVGTQAVRGYREAQANESKILTRDLMMKPDDFVMSIERYSVSLTSIIGWGRRIKKTNDEVAQLALAVMEAVNYIVPGLYLMEAIPILSKLPSFIYSTPSKIKAGANLFSKYFYFLTQEGAKVDGPTFAANLIEAQPKMNLSNKEVSGLAANLIGGGVDTTSSTMLSFILAMAYFPDVQKKVQAEFDAVVGHDRSPNWDDVDKRLPYLVATVKEVLRWRTVTILAGIPHANTVDFEYRGYHIPAGTNITGNMWAIHRNPRDFPDPDVLRPERFLNGLEKPYPNQRGSNPFGWGRRQCSGQPLAEQGLYYSLARIAWAFNIQPGLDKHGNEVKLDIFAYTNTENMRPEPFEVRFSPRTPKIQDMILSEAMIASEELSIYDWETKVTIKDALQDA